MKNIEDMTAFEIEDMMNRLKTEYTRRRGEFRESFATDWIEEWIDEVQSHGGLTITVVGRPSQQIEVKKWQLVMVDRQ